MSLDRPIFIVSPARTGTSLLYRCIGDHPLVGYLASADMTFPAYPRLARFLTRVGICKDSKREARRVWIPFHNISCVKLGVPAAARKFSRRIEAMLQSKGATRFVAKLPEFCRKIPWLDECFPDALFLQTARDWRPTVSSMLVKGEMMFGGGIFGTRRRGFVPRAGEPEEVTAARQLLEVNALLKAERDRLGSRFLVLWYEDLCTDPAAKIEGLFRFCDLPARAGFLRLPTEEIRPLSDQWRAILTPEKTAAVRTALGDDLLALEHPAINAGGEGGGGAHFSPGHAF